MDVDEIQNISDWHEI